MASTTVYSRVSTTQSPNAFVMLPSCEAAGDWACSRRFMARPRNGEAKPSLAPASAEMISRSGRTTNLSAKGPLAMAWDRIGSVEVTQAPMMRVE